MTLVDRVRSHMRLNDGLVAGLVSLLVVLFAVKPGSGGEHPLDPLALGLLLATVATIAASWSRPGLAAVLVLIVTAPWHARGYQGSLISILTLTCYYRLGTTASARQQVGIGALALSMTAAGTIAAGSEAPGTVWESGGWLVAAILLGQVVRSRRELLAEFEERAIQAEADREAEAHQRVAEERLRIARDLHDVLAHTVSLMTVQAGVVADSLERRPDRCHDAARALRAAGRDAMTEIRATVAVLRADGQAATTTPAPGLDQIGDLVESARATGLQVELTIDPAARPLPPVIELTTYRVVQEALTNVIRHAVARRAAVRIEIDGGAVAIAVHDDGDPITANHSAGFGLRGMAERIESLGGTLHHGPCQGGGFAVRAWIPLQGATS